MPLLVLLIGMLGMAALLARGPLLMNDFVEYWAAGTLNLAGQNPYDRDLILQTERAAGFEGQQALMMLNPPPVLTLTMPFGALPYRPAALLWLLLSSGALFYSCVVLWDYAAGPRQSRRLALLCGVLFVPSVFALLLGQISILVLLGIALFLRYERDGRMFEAGVASSLLLIKPHVVYLVGAAILAVSVRKRDRQFALGALLAGTACLIPLIFNPAVYAQYFEMSRTESLTHFSTSTLGTLLRIAARDPNRFGLQFLPMFLGLAFLAARLRRRRGAEWAWEEEMPALATVSVATAAYGWVFDQVVLLVTGLSILAVAARTGGRRLLLVLLFWLAIDAIGFEQARRGVDPLWYFWIPFAFLFALLAFRMDFGHSAGDQDACRHQGTVGTAGGMKKRPGSG